MMKYIIKRFLVIIFLLPYLGVTMLHAQDSLIAEGIWRGILQRTDGQQIVFNFETIVENSRPVLYVINGDERLKVDSIVVQGDSLWIQMPFFESGFAVKKNIDGNLEGVYLKHYARFTDSIPFIAYYNNAVRYGIISTPKYDLTGRWEVNFIAKNNKITNAIGEFQQQGNGRITGTFLTPTGDYRFLEGSVSGDSLKLSGFDGGHAFAFVAKIENNNTINTAFVFSGSKSKESWTATRNENASLPDGYSITSLREGEDRLNFKFKAVTGDTISINDPRFKNKIIIVQLLGSWCPNCLDETAYLSDFYKAYHTKGVEIIGLAYERTTDFNESKNALAPFIKRFNIQYPVLITGVEVGDPLRTEKTLPQIESIHAFPTTIIIDKKGVVKKIHAGFNGPGTGRHFEEFKKEFTQLIDGLLME